MSRRALVTILLLFVAVIVGLLLEIYTSAEVRDYLTLAAGTVATLALVQTWMSSTAATVNAEIARVNEDRKRYGWSVILHPDGDHYVIRNTGTLAATDIKLVLSASFAHAEFLQHEGDAGPTIQAGQAKAFRASFPWTSGGTELQIDWIPEGERSRQSFVEVLEPTANSVARLEENQREKLRMEGERHEAAAERHMAESRRLLVDLAGAWGAYSTEPTTQNKMRVQAIVGALPTNFVRAIGHAVDVPRDFWGEHQWPFEGWVEDHADKELLRQDGPMVELIWNLRQVQLPVFLDGDMSQRPEPWPRIERAIYGYRDLVRTRESDQYEYRDGPHDRRSRIEARQMIEEAEQIRRSMSTDEK